MVWKWLAPTEIYFGRNAIRENGEVFKGLGKKALVVTGRGGSARRNGSLEDVLDVLDSFSMEWEVFDKVEPNPSVSTVRTGAGIARKLGADFVVGIGGGSPMDTAKAIAVLAINDLSDEDLFAVKFDRALPVAAVPTTAGTGSEVTPYSILTWPEIENKKNLASSIIFPQAAFLDPGYTEGLPFDITADTAVDAFSHAFESYFTMKANSLSDAVAREAMRILGPELAALAREEIPSYERREKLLYGSLLAGLAISQTGTSIPHAVGYCFTYFKNVPHGRANGMVLPCYAEFNWGKTGHPKLQEAFSVSSFGSLEEFAFVIKKLVGRPPECSAEEREKFLDIFSQARGIANNLVKPTEEELAVMLRETLENGPSYA